MNKNALISLRGIRVDFDDEPVLKGIDLDITLLGLDKSADDAQGSCLATTGRPKKSNEFLVHDVKVDPLEDRLVIKIDSDAAQADQSIFVHFNILLLR